MMKKALLVCTFALSACATPMKWMKAGATQADYEKDWLQCDYEAKVATGSLSSGATSRNINSAIGQGVGEALAQAQAREEIGVACLKARGYTQVR